MASCPASLAGVLRTAIGPARLAGKIAYNKEVSMADKKPPSLYDIIEQVLARVPGSVSIDEVAKRVLGIYPSRAKNPPTSVRSTLRLEYAGKALVFLDRQTIVPLRVAMQGVRFRIPLAREEVDRGGLCIAPACDCFRRQGIAHRDMHLLDAAGGPLARIFVRRGTRCCCWHSRRITPLHRSPIRRNRPVRSTASPQPCGIGHSSGAVWRSRAARHWPT